MATLRRAQGPWTLSKRRSLRMLTTPAHAPGRTFNEIVPTMLNRRERGQQERSWSRALVSSRIRSPSGIQTASVSRRCLADPTRAIQRATQVLAKVAHCLAPQMKGAARFSRTTSLQAAVKALNGVELLLPGAPGCPKWYVFRFFFLTQGMLCFFFLSFHQQSLRLSEPTTSQESCECM